MKNRIETAEIRIDGSHLSVFEEWLKENPFSLRVHGVPKYSVVAVWRAKFSKGFEADLKLCSGTEEDTLWTEMVLFHNGTEVACTDCEETLKTNWEIEYGDVWYRIEIAENEDK